MTQEEKKTRRENKAKREVDAAGGSTMPPVPEREVDYENTPTPERKAGRQRDNK